MATVLEYMGGGGMMLLSAGTRGHINLVGVRTEGSDATCYHYEE